LLEASEARDQEATLFFVQLALVQWCENHNLPLPFLPTAAAATSPKSPDRVGVGKKQPNPFLTRPKRTLRSTTTLSEFIDDSQVESEESDEEFEEEEAAEEQPARAKGDGKALVKLPPKDPKLDISKLDLGDRQLYSITWSYNEHSKEHLTELRDQYFVALSGSLEHNGGKVRFSVAEAHQFVNFAFHTVFGAPGFAHLSRLISQYMVAFRKDRTDVARLARVAAADDSLGAPEVVRSYLDAFAGMKERSASANEVLVLVKNLKYMQASVRMYTSYDNVRQACEKGHQDRQVIEDFLSRQDSKKRTAMARMRDWIAATLGMSVEALKNEVALAQGIHCLVEHFGFGILVLVTKDVMAK
jgi:hypothetical protein